MTWSVVTLEDLKAAQPRAITDGPFGSNLARRHYTESGPRVVRLQNIGDGRFVDEKAHISEDHFRSLQAHEVQAGDLLLASLGAVLPRSCLAPPWLGSAIVKADCIRVRLGEGADPRWVLYALQRPEVRDWADEHRHGVGRPRLGLKAIRQIPIPLPPLDEQRRIVDLLEDHLSRLDAATLDLHHAAQRGRLLLECSVLSVFQKGVGKETTLGEVAEWGSGGTPSARTAAYYEGGTIPWVNSGDLVDGPVSDAPRKITERGLRESSAKWVPDGSVLVAMYGATIGKTGLTSAPVTTNQAIAFATPSSQVTCHWLHWFVRSQAPLLRRAGKGGAQPNISQTILKGWPLSLPSLEVQHTQVRRAAELEADLHRLHTSLAAAQKHAAALRRSLLAAAFSGRLTGSASDLSVAEEMIGA